MGLWTFIILLLVNKIWLKVITLSYLEHLLSNSPGVIHKWIPKALNLIERY